MRVILAVLLMSCIIAQLCIGCGSATNDTKKITILWKKMVDAFKNKDGNQLCELLSRESKSTLAEQGVTREEIVEAIVSTGNMSSAWSNPDQMELVDIEIRDNKAIVQSQTSGNPEEKQIARFVKEDGEWKVDALR